jgi:acyl transferase domain-containing protein
MITIQGNRALYDEVPLLRDNAIIVAINENEDFTLSASEGALIAIETYLKSIAVTYRVLPVKYPLHNPLLDSARGQFLNTLRQVRFSQPVTPFVSGVHAKQITTLDATYFWEAVRAPVCFATAISQLEAVGPHFYVDCSPSSECNTLLKKILPPSSSSVKHAVMDVSGHEQHNLKLLVQHRQALSLYS